MGARCSGGGKPPIPSTKTNSFNSSRRGHRSNSPRKKTRAQKKAAKLERDLRPLEEMKSERELRKMTLDQRIAAHEHYMEYLKNEFAICKNRLQSLDRKRRKHIRKITQS